MAERSAIYTQIMMLDGDRFMLPAAAVGETLNLEGMSLHTGGMHWLLGKKRWAGQDLQVVSLEGLCARPIPTRSARSRIVIVRLPDGRQFGMVCQGHPHLAPVSATALQPVDLTAIDPEDIILARIRIANIFVMVPDLEAIHRKLDQALEQHAAASLPDWEPQGLDS